MEESFLTVPIRGDKLAQRVQVAAQRCDIRSPFQRIEIFETEAFGKVLTLDRHIQLTDKDEAAYHEALTLIPLLNVAAPRSALVVGGGDGGVIHRLSLCPSLERIDMVEIDEQVVHACREHLPEVSGGAFEDPRVNLNIMDAFAFIQNPPTQYDLIVCDSTDVYEEEDGALSEQLFTAEFYSDCRNALTEGGVVVTQADNPVFCPYSLEHIRTMFQTVFPVVGQYWALVPSFGGYSGFVWGSKGAQISGEFPSQAAQGLPLQYLNPVTYRLAFSQLPF